MKTAHAASLIWQAFRPLVALLSLFLLVFTLIVGPGSYFADHRWCVFLLHPNRDGVWFREVQLQVSHRQIGFAVNTEVCADPESNLLQWVELDKTPIFSANPIGQSGSGDIEFAHATGLGFDYVYLDDADYADRMAGEGIAMRTTAGSISGSCRGGRCFPWALWE